MRLHFLGTTLPAPCSTKADNSRRINDGGSNQNEILFILGKLISGAPIKTGTNQFIEKKKILFKDFIFNLLYKNILNFVT